MSRDRFDFEQQLMHCWGVIEDIKELNECVLEKDVTNDFISNYLLGLETIYGVKFDQLWHDFENVLMPIVRENRILTDEVSALRAQLQEKTKGEK